MKYSVQAKHPIFKLKTFPISFIQEPAESPLKDDKLAVKEVAKSKEKSEFDDLGSLSDYEFGE